MTLTLRTERTVRMADKQNIIDRFLNHVSPEPNSGCWLWLACCTKLGYGRFNKTTDKSIPAYQMAYELFRGARPAGMDLDHLCRVPNCVNPWHLEAVTHKENMHRGIVGTLTAARNQRISHCPRGHAYDEANTRLSPNRHGTLSRKCKACEVRRAREYRRRNPGRHPTRRITVGAVSHLGSSDVAAE